MTPQSALLCLMGSCWFGLVSSLATADELHSALKNLSKSSAWEIADTLPLAFPTHHPQGLVKIDEHFYLSSVEVTEPPQRHAGLKNGFDRSAGSGVGHLFKIGMDGILLADLILGEDTLYHPGGIDYDGEFIWVSVAEYRPDSQSIVYKVDPRKMEASEVFRFNDHLGGIVHDPDSDTLIAVSWGSRKFYQWQGVSGVFTGDTAIATINGSYYIDYQDCQWVKPANMFCSGLNTYQSDKGMGLQLGGLELIDLANFKTTLQLPVTGTSTQGKVLTQNPFFAELLKSNELLFYFVPDDNNSSLYQYRITP